MRACILTFIPSLSDIPWLYHVLAYGLRPSDCMLFLGYYHRIVFAPVFWLMAFILRPSQIIVWFSDWSSGLWPSAFGFVRLSGLDPPRTRILQSGSGNLSQVLFSSRKTSIFPSTLSIVQACIAHLVRNITDWLICTLQHDTLSMPCFHDRSYKYLYVHYISFNVSSTSFATSIALFKTSLSLLPSSFAVFPAIQLISFLLPPLCHV